MKRLFILLLSVITLAYSCDIKPEKAGSDQIAQSEALEKHRPQFHFSPDSMWMNDPNGMVFYEGVYHLFYQYYPDSTVWGPMHWGHTTSTDMIHWEHKPVALYPDEHGYIFSGSAVLDHMNSSGFGTKGNPPLVAIFTYHDPVAARENPAMSQSQGIAYSLDKGATWTKYDNNPVLLSPGINDFRDPKVRWYSDAETWIMTLAVKDHIRFYSSPDLKTWSLESEFGKELGAHGGVWECPDLFPLKVEGSDEAHWILIVSINPGGPNGGSGTQYFIGDFDGSVFTPVDDAIRWLDYGPDNYAGVTWSNTGDRTLFIGWMSNWKYANIVPTERWRSAMTVARELQLEMVDGEMTISSMPVEEFDLLDKKKYEIPEFQVEGAFHLSEEINVRSATYELDVELAATEDFDLVLSNSINNQLVISYKKEPNVFTIDRSRTGDTSFHAEFANLIQAPRFAVTDQMSLKLVVDVASVELFADDGTTVMTAILFPDQVLDQLSILSKTPLSIDLLELRDIQ
jgi:fructan beta-fructosidase